MTLKILPSLLSANLLTLEQDLLRLTEAGIDSIHIDVMDGHFVPNLTFGPGFVRQLRNQTDFWLDTHLMISPLEPLLMAFCEAGSHSLTFHIEATDAPGRVIDTLRKKDCKVGISLKPHTPLEAILPWLPLVDLVLIMTVEPGFGGQAFLPDQLVKLTALAELKRTHFPHLILEVDGGITAETLPTCQKAGADYFVAGTAVFGGGNKEISARLRTLSYSLQEKI